MRCTPTIHDLIVLTLPPRHCCPLNRLPASRLLLPRSGLERSDFVLWHFSEVLRFLLYGCYRGKSGSDSDTVKATRLTQLGHRGCPAFEAGCVRFLPLRPVAKCYVPGIALSRGLKGAHMQRREFITLLVGTAQAAWPLAARAHQPAGKLPRIGYIGIQTFQNENTEAFRQGLRKAGYVDGQNMLLETRLHQGTLDRINEFSRELVALKCSVIFAANPYAIRAVMKATSGLDLESDPVASGWVKSLARPGGKRADRHGLLKKQRDKMPRRSGALRFRNHGLPNMEHSGFQTGGKNEAINFVVSAADRRVRGCKR